MWFCVLPPISRKRVGRTKSRGKGWFSSDNGVEPGRMTRGNDHGQLKECLVLLQASKVIAQAWLCNQYPWVMCMTTIRKEILASAWGTLEGHVESTKLWWSTWIGHSNQVEHSKGPMDGEWGCSKDDGNDGRAARGDPTTRARSSLEDIGDLILQRDGLRDWLHELLAHRCE